jgi:hypothetical protein
VALKRGPILLIIIWAFFICSFTDVASGQFQAMGVNPFDPSIMLFQTKIEFLSEGTPAERAAVLATLQGVSQILHSSSDVTGSPSQLFFSLVVVSKKQLGKLIVAPVEVDMKAPLSTMPGPGGASHI